MAIHEIKIGDKIECLNCKKPIIINENSFQLRLLYEAIVCPSCGLALDVQLYHLDGKKL